LDGRVARRTATDLSQSRTHAGEDRLGPRGAVTSSAAPHVFLARAKVSIADDDKLKKNQRVRKESASQNSYRLLLSPDDSDETILEGITIGWRVYQLTTAGLLLPLDG